MSRSDRDEWNFDSIQSFYIEIIAPHFDFLVHDYGFVLDDVSEKDLNFLEEFIHFTKGDAGIIIQIGRWGVIGIGVGRATDDGYVTPLVRLDTLIRRRSPTSLVKRKPGEPLDLQHYADFLKEHCIDILEGEIDGLTTK